MSARRVMSSRWRLAAALVSAAVSLGALFTTAEAAVSAIYDVPRLPSMSTCATDTWPLRARGVQCIGIGAGVDLEDQSAAQERLSESESQRFARFNWDLVTRLVRRR